MDRSNEVATRIIGYREQIADLECKIRELLLSEWDISDEGDVISLADSGL